MHLLCSQRLTLPGVIFLIAVLGIGHGCGGNSDITAARAVFLPSPAGMRADGVRLTGSALDEETVLVRVMIGGPTTSSDLYSFAFDLVLSDQTVARYVPGSARFGDALRIDAAQGRSVLVSQEGNRVVIGVSKTGGGPGNGLQASGENEILDLEFDVVDRGTTTLRFAGSPGNPGNPTTDPAALDSLGRPVPSVSFDGQAAVISR